MCVCVCVCLCVYIHIYAYIYIHNTYMHTYMCVSLFLAVTDVDCGGLNRENTAAALLVSGNVVLLTSCHQTSAYVSIRQHTSAYVSIRQRRSSSPATSCS